MKTQSKPCSAAVLAVALGLIVGCSAAVAAVAAVERGSTQAPASHAHQHAPASHGDATPEQGWPTDAPLRLGMEAMLDALVVAVRDQGDGATLAADLRRQVDLLFANCKLDPAADAALHVLIVELLDSAQRLEAGATPAEEHDALNATLQRYGQQFQHPGWPLR